MIEHWRLALDAASVFALFGTAVIAWLAWREQKRVAETMGRDKVLSRITYLEERDAGAPTREDFMQMSDRVGAVERDVSAINASLVGIHRSLSGIEHTLGMITEHLLSQGKGGAS